MSSQLDIVIKLVLGLTVSTCNTLDSLSQDVGKFTGKTSCDAVIESCFDVYEAEIATFTGDSRTRESDHGAHLFVSCADEFSYCTSDEPGGHIGDQILVPSPNFFQLVARAQGFWQAGNQFAPQPPFPQPAGPPAIPDLGPLPSR